MGFTIPQQPDITQLAYYLVAIPDDPIYKRAIIGHFGELGSAKVWGEEGITAESHIAAQAWLRALNETFELLEMGWPQQILAAIDEVEALLAVLQNVPQFTNTCCGSNQAYTAPPGGYTSTDPVPQAVVDAGYATTTADYDGYNDYKCMVAHLLINNFESKLIDLGPIITAGAVILSILVAFFAAGTGLTGIVIAGLTVGVSELLGLIDALKDLGAPGVVALADDMEDNRDELVCAILSGDGILGAIDSYKDKVDELFGAAAAFIIKSLNVDYMFQHYLAAAYGNVDVAEQLAAAGYDTADYTCTCGYDFDTTEQFTGGFNSWLNDEFWAQNDEVLTEHSNVTGRIAANIGIINTNQPGAIPTTGTAQLKRMSFKVGRTSAGDPMGFNLWAGGQLVANLPYTSIPVSSSATEYLEYDLSALNTINLADFVSGDEIVEITWASGGNGARTYFDDIRIAGDMVV